LEPVYREVNGLQLAFLAFEDVALPLDTNAAVQAIRSARATRAVVIVSVHWGAEYQGGASDRQKFLAQEFAEAGAALIWGHHPHVLQPAAWIETAQGKTLVLYSLGNALFDQGGLDDTRRSALVVVTLDAKAVTSVRNVPFEIDVVNSRVVQPDAGTVEKIQDRLNLP
jgi:poly-gamma-glutamate capsule biosynthesis protein CapA/YwtB (metallophosphatase superfamily)